MNAWLATRALRNERSGDSRTFVTIDEDTGQIAGYYSLAAWAVSHAEAGGGWLKRNAPDPISVVLLGRLATSLDARRLGVGRDLLADALSNATIAAQVIGARALVAEAIDTRAAQWYAKQGLTRSTIRSDLCYARLV
ncbi:GNAT family N-acetyltransferase [Xylanimonas ulmi]|nr:GNAT family N-acetyltransferase [Xylanibacterium ulmi]